MKPAGEVKILYDFTGPDACPRFAIDDVVRGACRAVRCAWKMVARFSRHAFVAHDPIRIDACAQIGQLGDVTAYNNGGKPPLK